MKEFRIATMMFAFNGVGDRFLESYFDPMSPPEVFSSLAGGLISGVELQHPFQVNEENAREVSRELSDAGLELVLVNIPMASSSEWKRGTFTSPDAGVRQRAVARVKAALDVCKTLGCPRVSLFFGQDGFDYPFVTDYRAAWRWLVECLQDVADYAGDVRMAIEYKPREPRSQQFLSSAAKTMLLLDDVAAANTGLLIDVGHVLMAQENMAETICIAADRGRLFHVHYNDNLRLADDDLGAGALHPVELLESIWWLSQVDYDGWLSLDVHSPREDPVQVIHESAQVLAAAQRMLASIDDARLRSMVASRDGTQLLRFVRQTMLKGGTL